MFLETHKRIQSKKITLEPKKVKEQLAFLEDKDATKSGLISLNLDAGNMIARGSVDQGVGRIVGIWSDLEQIFGRNTTVKAISIRSCAQARRHNAVMFVKAICDNPSTKVEELSITDSFMTEEQALSIALMCREKKIKINLTKLVAGAYRYEGGQSFDFTISSVAEDKDCPQVTFKDARKLYYFLETAAMLQQKFPKAKLVIVLKEWIEDPEVRMFFYALKGLGVSLSVSVNHNIYRYSYEQFLADLPRSSAPGNSSSSKEDELDKDQFSLTVLPPPQANSSSAGDSKKEERRPSLGGSAGGS